MCAEIRANFGGREPIDRLLRAASGLDPNHLPEDDRQFWLALAAGAVSPWGAVPGGVFDSAVDTAWEAMQHPDWFAIGLVNAEGGPRTDVGPNSPAEAVATFDEDDADDFLGNGDDPFDAGDDGGLLLVGLFPVIEIWRALGAVDLDDCVTPLGWWGIPESILHAWRPRD